MAIITKVRDLIEDILKSNASTPDTFEYLSSLVFTLSEPNVDSSTIVVYKNGVLWNSSNYSFDSDTNKLTVTGTIVVGDALEVHYSFYNKYSDNEILGYIRSALYHLSIEKFKDFIFISGEEIFPTPSVPEENLIALIASILIKKSIKSYRTNEVTITFAENLSVEEKIKRVIKQYKKSLGNFRYVDLGETYRNDENEQNQNIG